jgi:hypothetical protein
MPVFSLSNYKVSLIASFQLIDDKRFWERNHWVTPLDRFDGETRFFTAINIYICMVFNFASSAPIGSFSRSTHAELIKSGRVTDELGCEKTTYCPAHESCSLRDACSGGRRMLLIDRRVIKLGLQADAGRASAISHAAGGRIDWPPLSHARVTRGVKSDPKNTQESGGGQTETRVSETNIVGQNKKKCWSLFPRVPPQIFYLRFCYWLVVACVCVCHLNIVSLFHCCRRSLSRVSAVSKTTLCAHADKCKALSPNFNGLCCKWCLAFSSLSLSVSCLRIYLCALHSSNLTKVQNAPPRFPRKPTRLVPWRLIIAIKRKNLLTDVVTPVDKKQKHNTHRNEILLNISV